MLATLAEVRGQEVERGVCLVGPHRDDVVLTLGELPAKGYASHGESWSFALGLKLAAYQLLRHDLGDDPVLVLDDVFAELDSGRRERLAAMVADCEQVLITAAVPRGRAGRADRAHVCRDAGLGDRACLTTRCRPDDAETVPAQRIPTSTSRRAVGDAAEAAAAALARARAAAKAKGLRPGLRPRRRVKDVPVGERSQRPAATPSCSATSSTSSSPTAAGSVDVAVGAVIGRWPQIVGPEIAAALRAGRLRRRRPHRARRLDRLGDPAAAARRRAC